MLVPAYPAARAAAARVQRYFAEQAQAAREQERENVAPEPGADLIEALMDQAFWASLRREEGYVPTISLAFVPPGQSEGALLFEKPISLAADALARLAPAVERPGIHLGVWPDDGELRVWGTAIRLPSLCFVLEVVAPGLLVVKHTRRDDSAKYVNVAVLEGGNLKLIVRNAAGLPDCSPIVRSLLASDSAAATEESINLLVQLAVSMRAHHRGGALLVTPSDSTAWMASIVQPIHYAVSPPFAGLATLMREDAQQRGLRRWEEALRRAIDTIAGLTAVDGATVINDRYELLAFGAKIARRKGWPQVEQVLVTEPVEGVEPVAMAPNFMGGTRHLSAAQFTQDQRDTVALVASQDGGFTIFGWSPSEGMVHAHRIESLLL